MSWSWNIFILRNEATTVIDYDFSLGEDPTVSYKNNEDKKPHLRPQTFTYILFLRPML